MYIKTDSSKEIIDKAVKEAGSYRILSKLLKIPRSSLAGYRKNKAIPEKRFKKIVKFLKIDPKKLKTEKLADNWKSVKGGKIGVKLKKKNGTFKSQLKIAQKNGIKKIKEWHKRMKEENPREYYKMQYSKFKMIGGYKQVTKRGEKVRNIFEKEVADLLYQLKIDYEYEPLINIGKRYFYPDFLINKKIIIECTAWKGETKAYKLKEKIKILGKNYKVFVVIPKTLYSYYKILDKNLISGLDKFVRVAQTFPPP